MYFDTNLLPLYPSRCRGVSILTVQVDPNLRYRSLGTQCANETAYSHWGEPRGFTEQFSDIQKFYRGGG